MRPNPTRPRGGLDRCYGELRLFFGNPWILIPCGSNAPWFPVTYSNKLQVRLGMLRGRLRLSQTCARTYRKYQSFVCHFEKLRSDPGIPAQPLLKLNEYHIERMKQVGVWDVR